VVKIKDEATGRPFTVSERGPEGTRGGRDQVATRSRSSGSAFFKNVYCVREPEILVEQQPPQGVFVCDRAGLAE